jgi:O-antigen ligase
VATNPKGFAMFIAPLTLLALAAFVTTRSRVLHRWSAVLVLMGTGAIVLTFTRATWAGFIMGSALIVGMGLRRRRLLFSRVAVVALAAGATVVALLPLILVRLSEDHVAAYDERAYLMGIAWRIIEDHWFGGVGAGAYSIVLRDYVTPFEMNSRWLHVVHNAYLLRWAETGLFGLLSLFVLFGAGFRSAVRCTRSADAMTFALGLGWCAGLLHLSWELWWDLGLGGSTRYLFWFVLGVVQAAAMIEQRERAAVAVPVESTPPPLDLRTSGAMA